MTTAPALDVVGIEAGYEPGLAIVRGASLALQQGEILAVLGPNGAGKSTLVKAAAGLVPKFAGRVSLHGRDITAVPAHQYYLLPHAPHGAAATFADWLAGICGEAAAQALALVSRRA